MTLNTAYKILAAASLILLGVAIASPTWAHEGLSDGVVIRDVIGPTIAGKAVHGWISLFAALGIFILSLHYMSGGQLAKPIMLIGWGAFIDALFGLIPSPYAYMQMMWLGNSLFSVSLILAVIWMAHIFGIFERKPLEGGG